MRQGGGGQRLQGGEIGLLAACPLGQDPLLLAALQQRAAVESENFELAAELRDRLRVLE